MACISDLESSETAKTTLKCPCFLVQIHPATSLIGRAGLRMVAPPLKKFISRNKECHPLDLVESFPKRH